MFLWEKNQGPQKFHSDSQAYNLREIQCVKKMLQWEPNLGPHECHTDVRPIELLEL